VARRWAALAPLLLAVACAQPTGPAPPESVRGEWRTFEGSWTSAGTRQTLDLGPDHRASIFDLTGSLLLTGEGRPAVGFRARVIGFADNLAGMHGRSVWTDERGDQVYSELKSESTGTGDRVIGTVLGGTGRYAGVTGEYSFRWQYMVDSEDGAVSGRVVDLRGRVRVGAAAPAAGMKEAGP
jgi:hypothetical protein